MFFLGLVVNNLVSIQYGFGKHIWEIRSLSQAISVQKVSQPFPDVQDSNLTEDLTSPLSHP